MNKKREVSGKISRDLESLDSLKDLGDVKLDLKQVQKATGIKKGRIRYWTESGYIRDLDESEDAGYHYTPEEIKKIVLMDRLRDGEKSGDYSVEAASRRAKEILDSIDNQGTQALLMLIEKQLESRMEELADELVEAGVADQIIEALGEEAEDGEGKNKGA